LFPIGSHLPYVSTVSVYVACPSWRCTYAGDTPSKIKIDA